MKIGIFGGTFDPFTEAHLAIVESALVDKLVDKVIIVPTIVTWHREGKCQWLNAAEKLRVIFAAIDASDYEKSILVDGSELLLDNPPNILKNRRYVHMLSDITFKYGIDNDYYTIVGTDSIWNFATWWNYKAILDMSKLIVVKGRDDIKLPNDTFGAIELDIPAKYANVSASEIRTQYNNVDEYIANFFTID